MYYHYFQNIKTVSLAKNVQNNFSEKISKITNFVNNIFEYLKQRKKVIINEFKYVFKISNKNYIINYYFEN